MPPQCPPPDHLSHAVRRAMPARRAKARVGKGQEGAAGLHLHVEPPESPTADALPVRTRRSVPAALALLCAPPRSISQAALSNAQGRLGPRVISREPLGSVLFDELTSPSLCAAGLLIVIDGSLRGEFELSGRRQLPRPSSLGLAFATSRAAWTAPLARVRPTAPGHSRRITAPCLAWSGLAPQAGDDSMPNLYTDSLERRMIARGVPPARSAAPRFGTPHRGLSSACGLWKGPLWAL